MTGYVRNDTSNNIADGKAINAADFDGEYDAIEAAFDNSTGHSHDGSSAEGAPITVVGPNQEYVGAAGSFAPKTDDTYDLGTNVLQWKDLFINGIANIDSLVAGTVDIDSGAIDGTVVGGTTPAAGTFTNLAATAITGPLTGNVTGDLTGDVTGNVTGVVTGSLTGNADSATVLSTARDFSITGHVLASAISFDGSGNVTFSSTVVDDSHNHTLDTITDSGTIAEQDSDNISITGGDIDGVPIGASSASTGAFTTLDATGTVTLSGQVVSAAGLNLIDDASAADQRVTLESLFHTKSATNVDTEAVTESGLYHFGTSTTNLWDTPSAGDFGLFMYDDADNQGWLGFDDAGGLWRRAKRSGTWSNWFQYATQPYVTQNAFAGSNYTWKDVSGSRAHSTTYTNNSGGPRQVSFGVTSGSIREVEVSSDAFVSDTIVVGRISTSGFTTSFTFTVPDGYSYRINGAVTNIQFWSELDL